MNININNILNIDMTKLKFNLSDQVPTNKDGNTLINLGQGILDIAYNEEQAVFKLKTQFVLLFSDESIEINPKIYNQDVSFQDDDNYLLIDYNLYFDLKNEVQNHEELIEDETFTKEIYAILEPYIRQSINSVFNQSHLPDPFLPYRYWEKFYADT